MTYRSRSKRDTDREKDRIDLKIFVSQCAIRFILYHYTFSTSFPSAQITFHQSSAHAHGLFRHYFENAKVKIILIGNL